MSTPEAGGGPDARGAPSAGSPVAERIRASRAAALLVVCYLVFQLAGLRSIGLTDDDDFYIPAGISYAGWLGKALTFQPGAWSRAAIDAAFEPNHEHPPVAKYVFGICHHLLPFLGPTDSARVGTVLFSTLAAALLLVLALRHLGPRRGLFAGGVAVVLLAVLPRFYFHSHAATLDVPVSAMYLAVATVVLLGERSLRAAVVAGPVFGLASATKLNAPFFLVGYALFILLVRRRRVSSREERGLARTHLLLPNLPVAVISMAVLGPLVFLISWPWLWFDTIQRVTGYVGFHLHHYGIHLLYFGEVFTKDPFAPWHAPFVMAAITTPLAISVLAFAGIRRALGPIRLRLRFPDGPDDDQRREGDLVLTLVIHAALSIAIVAFSRGAKYGGEKLFMPFFPFWCLLAGYGALAIMERVELAGGAWRRWAPTAVVLAAVGSSGLLQLRFGGYALSQYNALAGGLRGATALGMERQYYDVAYRDLVAWLNQEAPKNTRIHFLPNNWEYVRTYNWYRKAGELRADLQVVQNESQADWLIVTHERRFARYGDDLLRYRGRRLLREKILDGTPLWSAFQVRGGAEPGP